MANPARKAVQGNLAKNQDLILEIHIRATDTEKKVAKPLTCAELSGFEVVFLGIDFLMANLD